MQKLPSDSSDTANINDAIGTIHFVTGEFEQARERFEAAVRICRLLTGSNELLASKLNNLASCLTSLELFDQASAIFEEALGIYRGMNYHDQGNECKVAMILSNLARAMMESGRVWEARDMLEEALDSDIGELGESHVEVSRDMKNLAQFYIATNQIVEAKKMLERVLALDICLHGESGLEVAGDYNQLGILWADMGHYEKARPLLEKCVQIHETVNGESFELGQALNVMAFLLLNMRQEKKAAVFGRRAVQIFERYVEPHNPLVVETKKLWGA